MNLRHSAVSALISGTSHSPTYSLLLGFSISDTTINGNVAGIAGEASMPEPPVTAFPGDDADALGETLHKAACHLGYRTCERACWVSDGDKPLWNRYRTRFSRGKNHAMGLLDLYHNMEHVSAFALDLSDGDAAKAARWAADSKDVLKVAGGGAFLRRVERATRKHGRDDEAKRKKPDDAALYFRDHRRHMD